MSVTVSLTLPAVTITSTVRGSRLTSVTAIWTTMSVVACVSGMGRMFVLLCGKPGVPATKLSPAPKVDHAFA